MAVCAVQPLLDEANCFMALDRNKAEVIELQMLCQIKNKLDSGAAVSCDIQTLLNDAECFYNLNPQMRLGVKLQLLCDISNLIP